MNACVRLVLLSMLWLARPCAAIGLLDLYDEAVATHPVIKQGESAVELAEANKDIARSRLLPQVSASGNVSWNDLSQQQRNALSGRNTDASAEYKTIRGSVQARQSILDLPSLFRFQGSRAAVEQSREQLESARMSVASDLIDRYFDVLAASDQVRYVRSETRATEVELRRLHAMQERKMVPVTDVLEVEAYYQGLLSKQLEAEHNFAIGLAKLRQSTGLPVANVALLGRAPLPPVVGDAEEWVQRALDSHPGLRAAQRGIDVARRGQLAARAEHLPQLAMQVSETHAENGGFDNRRESPYSVATVGLQLSIPLYAGGGINAASRAAAAEYGTALDKRDELVREVELRTRSAFLEADTAWSRVQSTAVEMIARRKARQAQRKSYELRLATVGALLDARKNYMKARVKHAKARYRYLVARLSLSVWGGTLARSDIEDIDRLLVEPAAESGG